MGSEGASPGPARSAKSLGGNTPSKDLLEMFALNTNVNGLTVMSLRITRISTDQARSTNMRVLWEATETPTWSDVFDTGPSSATSTCVAVNGVSHPVPEAN